MNFLKGSGVYANESQAVRWHLDMEKEAWLLVLGDLWSLPPPATHIYLTSAKRMNTTQLMGVLLNYYI